MKNAGYGVLVGSPKIISPKSFDTSAATADAIANVTANTTTNATADTTANATATADATADDIADSTANATATAVAIANATANVTANATADANANATANATTNATAVANELSEDDLFYLRIAKFRTVNDLKASSNWKILGFVCNKTVLMTANGFKYFNFDFVDTISDGRCLVTAIGEMATKFPAIEVMYKN